MYGRGNVLVQPHPPELPLVLQQVMSQCSSGGGSLISAGASTFFHWARPTCIQIRDRLSRQEQRLPAPALPLGLVLDHTRPHGCVSSSAVPRALPYIEVQISSVASENSGPPRGHNRQTTESLPRQACMKCARPVHTAHQKCSC